MQQDGVSRGSDRILFGGGAYRLSHREQVRRPPPAKPGTVELNPWADPERLRDVRLELAEAHYRLDNKRMQVVLLSAALIGVGAFNLAKRVRRCAAQPH